MEGLSMEARLLRAALAAALALLFCAAGRPAYGQGHPLGYGGGHSVRSQHFIVTAPSAELAQEVCQAAEVYRRDLAIEWLGQELPPWHDICPIRVKLDSGAGGATSFVFRGGVPTQWTMQIQGTRERLLDSVLPHEVTHTIFATHFGGPLPRWADEGACTTVEHASEKAKQDKLLIRFLAHENRGIAFNKMFAMRDYPRDILPLYSQGYSLTRYLIQQGGKRKFVAYVGEGMQTNNWPAATKKFYGFESLSDLQVTWLAWVQQGSPSQPDVSSLAATETPAAQPVTQMASLTQQPQSRIPDGALASWQTPQAQNARALARFEQPKSPAMESSLAVPEGAAPQGGVSSVSRPVSDGWYARRRDQAQAVLQATPAAPAESSPNPVRLIPSPPSQAPVHPASTGRKVLMEWSRPQGHEMARNDVLTGVVRQ
jgi:hypothetical protein